MSNFNSVAQLLMQALLGAIPHLFNSATVSIDQPIQIVGSGQHDLTSSGTFTDTVDHLYTIKITATNKFQWKKDSGAFSMDVTITGMAQSLVDGVSVTFGHTSGYTLNDQFTIKAHAGVAITAEELVNIDINSVGNGAELQIFDGNGTDGNLLYDGLTADWTAGSSLDRHYFLQNSKGLYVVLTASVTFPKLVVGYR